MHLDDIVSYFLTLFLLFVVANSYTQEIELQGRYSASFVGGESIKFVGRDSFYFSGFYCTYGVRGKGRCEIRNNYLYLYFEKRKSTTKDDSLKPAIITKTQNTASVVEIKIIIVDNNEISIPYSTVAIGSGNSAKIATITDSSGRATIKLKNNSSPIIVSTSAIGIDSGYLKLEGGSNYYIKLFHRQNHLFNKELNSGEILVYEIDELSEELIRMRPKNSSERFRRYRRI